MSTIRRLVVSMIAMLAAQYADASCLQKAFSTMSPDNGYVYIFDAAAGAATSASLIGRFWSPGSYASTGEQGCNESFWLQSCPGCGGGPAGRTWYINGTLGQMGCVSGCPSSEMIVTLEDASTDGQSAFFAASRVNETPLASVAFDFARSGRNWTLAPMPAPQIVSSTTGELFTAHFVIPDPAPGFFGLAGAPASSTITAFWLYTKPNASGPRERDSWSFVGRYPYSGGVTAGDASLVCPATGGYPFLAAAIEFDSGQVVTTYLSHAAMVECDTYAAGAGAVRDGGPSGLFIARNATGDLALTWGRSCSAGDNDYEIYEGTIGDWASHAPRTCSTAGALTATLSPPPFDAYYLVVPSESPYEGSYGARSGGVERPLGAAVCRSRIINSCPP